MNCFNILSNNTVNTSNNTKENIHTSFTTNQLKMSSNLVSFGSTKILNDKINDNYTEQIKKLSKKSRLSNEEQIEAVGLYQKIYSDILKLNNTPATTQQENILKNKKMIDLKEKQKIIAQKLLSSIDGFINHSICKCWIPKIFFSDVKQSINLELLDNIFLKFNVNKMNGTNFLTYVGICIQKDMRLFANQLKGMNKFSKELQYVHLTHKARNEYKMITGNYPSDEELTKILQHKFKRPALLVDTVKSWLYKKSPVSAVSLSTPLNKYSNKTLYDTVYLKQLPDSQSNDAINKRFYNVIVRIAQNNKTYGPNAKIFIQHYVDKKTYYEIAQNENKSKARIEQIVKSIKTRILSVIREEIKKNQYLTNGNKDFCERIFFYLQNEPEELEKLIRHFENMTDKEISLLKVKGDKDYATKLIKSSKLSDREISIETGYPKHKIKMLRDAQHTTS